MCIHHLFLESTISAVHADHITYALVTNKTCSSVTLKNYVLLGTFELLDLSSIEGPLPLPVAGINTEYRCDRSYQCYGKSEAPCQCLGLP